MKRYVAILLFGLLAAGFAGSFALYAFPAAERAALQGKYMPLLAMANAVRVNAIDPNNPPNLRVESQLREPPPFYVPDLQGRTRSLDEFRGKVVFINFWASWCGPCREEWDGMMRLAATMKSETFVMLAVSVDEDDQALADFLKEFGVAPNVLILHDKDKSNGRVARVANSFGSTKWPETFIVDPEGMLLHRFIGPRLWASREASSYLRAVQDAAGI